MRFVWKVVTPDPPSSDDKTVETTATRVALIDLQSQLLATTAVEDEYSGSHATKEDELILYSCRSTWRDTGFALYGMSSVALAVDRVYRYHGLILADDKELVLLKRMIHNFHGPITNAARLRMVQRMMESFIVFRS